MNCTTMPIDWDLDIMNEAKEKLFGEKKEEDKKDEKQEDV